jgi:hypothetical protein
MAQTCLPSVLGDGGPLALVTVRAGGAAVGELRLPQSLAVGAGAGGPPPVGAGEEDAVAQTQGVEPPRPGSWSFQTMFLPSPHSEAMFVSLLMPS